MKIYLKLFITFFFISFVGLSQAESTLVLDLQEKMNKTYQEFSQQSKKIKKIRSSDVQEKANYWHSKAQALPRNSRDYNYAIAKFVNERVKMLEPEIESVIKMEQLTNRLEGTVIKLRKAVSKKANDEHLLNRNLSPEFYQETKQQVIGMTNIINVLMKDPSISKNPSRSNILMLGFSLGDKLKRVKHAQPRQDPVKHLMVMEDYLESQAEVISMIREDYEDDYNTLKTLSVSKDISMSSQQVTNMLGMISGLYNDRNVQRARAQTVELIDQVQGDWGEGRVSIGEDRRWEDYTQDMKVFFDEGAIN